MKQDTLYAIIWQMRPLLQQIESAVETGLAGTPLTVRMRAVLEILDDDGPRTVPALARRLEINRQYVQTMVNETQSAGLTERRDNPAHRSSPLIALTDEGTGIIRRVRRAEAENVRAMAEPLTEEEIASAKKVFDHLLDRFRALNESAR